LSASQQINVLFKLRKNPFSETQKFGRIPKYLIRAASTLPYLDFVTGADFFRESKCVEIEKMPA